MSDRARELLVYGIASAKAKEFDSAYRYLERVQAAEPSMDQLIDSWLWLSEITQDPTQKRSYLESVLSSRPTEPRAIRSLAILDGRLSPQDVIDPDRIPEKTPGEGVGPINGSRFICPTCGGKMTFTPDGLALTCESCQNKQKVDSGLQSSSLLSSEAGNFTLELATARGHRPPEHEHTFVCKGCGAHFIFPPQMITAICPYCNSDYVIEFKKDDELIPPSKIIPLKISKRQAQHSILEWLKSHSFLKKPAFGPGFGIYIPIWLFDISGSMEMRYVVVHEKKSNIVTKQIPVNRYNIPIPAIKGSYRRLVDQALPSFDLSLLVQFDRKYLANWTAETYTIPLADASLDARQIVVNEENKQSYAFSTSVQDFSMNSAGIAVTGYQLALIPLWITSYQHEGSSFKMLINGQNGKIFAERPSDGVLSWLESIF